MKNISFLLFFIPVFVFSQNYALEIVHDSMNSSLRGLCAVDENVIWASGSNGYIGKSTDGGSTWSFNQVHPYDSAEFRDIEAFDENTAIAMSSTNPACIIKTKDGGQTWKEVYYNDDPAVFLDAIDFYDERGICLGDPVDGWFFILSSDDMGETWTILPKTNLQSVEGEAAFAASGSALFVIDENNFVFASGGKVSNLYFTKDAGLTWERSVAMNVSGTPARGIFSIDIFNKQIITGGGDYEHPDSVVFTLHYRKRYNGNEMPVFANSIGYVSCVKWMNKNTFLACGTNGVVLFDVKKNNSTKITSAPFHVISMCGDGRTIFLAGSNGRIAKLTF